MSGSVLQFLKTKNKGHGWDTCAELSQMHSLSDTDTTSQMKCLHGNWFWQMGSVSCRLYTRKVLYIIKKDSYIYIYIDRYWFIKLLLANSFSYFGECFVVNVLSLEPY